MKIFNIFIFFITLSFPILASAMEPGTLLYRTSSEGKMYGFSSKELLRQKSGIITNIYSGHAGIYVGEVDGEDYVVEALGSGVVMTPAKYFVNENEGEQLVAARIPKDASAWQRAKAVALAKYLARSNLAYDFDFSSQKGPWSGDWTCVGLTEKLYESANAVNPEKLGALEYNPKYYAVNITPDGYDRENIYSPQGDVFSRSREYSKISRRKTSILPAPEILGYNAGKIEGSDRFFFIPYTQALQKTMMDVPVDLDLSSRFPQEEVRGAVNNLGVILRWSLINNPISGIKSFADAVKTEWNNIFPAKSEADRLAWGEGSEGPTKLVSELEEEKKHTDEDMLADINPAFEQVRAKTEIDKAEEAELEEEEATETVDKHPQARPASLEKDIFAAARPDTITEDEVEEQAEKITEKKVAIWTPIKKVEEKSVEKDEEKKEVSEKEEDKTEEEISADLVISRIHAQGDDDWIEIWNYGDADIDLAEAKIRLEKAKSASDPGIMLRFESSSDASFQGGTLVRAGEGFRIVRDDAAAELRQAADAIALRSDFSLTDKGYTIYLAKGAVSGPEDEDIVDKVGYGEATYYEGSGSAPALKEGYMIRRKADASTLIDDILDEGAKESWPPIYDNNDNAKDFLLWPLGGKMPENEEEQEEEEEDEEDDNNEDNEEEEQENGNSGGGYTMVEGLGSPGLMRLWAFNECDSAGSYDSISSSSSAYLKSEGKRAIGRFGCGMMLPFQGLKLKATTSPMLSGGAFSFAFRFKGKDDYGHPTFLFENSQDNSILQFDLFSFMAEFHGFPGLEGRYDMQNFMNNEWHQGVLVWNANDGYWALNIDGEELFYQEFSGLAPGFDLFSLGGVAGEVIVDELALWNRALSESEIQKFASEDKPFNPVVYRNPPPSLTLLHQYEFDEVTGDIAQDAAGNLDWTLPASAIVYNGKEGRALDYPRSDNPYALQLPAISSEGFSFSWWWKNDGTLPYSGRMHLDMYADNVILAQLALDGGRQIIKSAGNDDIFVENPSAVNLDNLWHHLVLAYDDYLWRWNLFVDGKLMISEEKLPLPASMIDNIKISNTGNAYKIDKFKIWKGTMNAAKAKEEYDREK